MLQVLFVDDGLAIIEGLNNDAPVGCALSFVSGAAGALLWRRSDNICFALLLGGGSSVEVGEGVECKVKAVLQVPRSCLLDERHVPHVTLCTWVAAHGSLHGVTWPQHFLGC